LGLEAQIKPVRIPMIAKDKVFAAIGDEN